jgi:7-cyano-7-deazaguanine reductase
VRGTAERLDLIEWKGSKTARHTLDCTEFTSLCPVTGQPDFGRLVIEYTPGTHIVETKSLKLWLRNWRERGVFNEVIVEEIADAFAKQVRPRSLLVCGAFNLRGGISVTAESRRARA